MISTKILLTIAIVGIPEGVSGYRWPSMRQKLFRKVRESWDNRPELTKDCTEDEIKGNCAEVQPPVCVVSFARYPSTRNMCDFCSIQHPYNYKPGPCPGQMLNYLASFLPPLNATVTSSVESSTMTDETTTGDETMSDDATSLMHSQNAYANSGKSIGPRH